MLGEGKTDVLYRVVVLAKRDDLLAHGVLSSHARWATNRSGKEELTGVRVMAELMAENAECAWGIPKGARGLRRRTLLEKIGTEGFVLTLTRESRKTEELGRVR